MGIALFLLFVLIHLGREEIPAALVDLSGAALLVVYLLFLRRFVSATLTAVLSALAIVAILVVGGSRGGVQSYFWASLGPLLFFFFAGARTGTLLTALVAVVLGLLLAFGPPLHVSPHAEVSLVLSFLAVAVFAFISERRRQEFELELRRLSDTDGLTGLANRRRFHELLGAEHDRAVRYGRRYALLLADADRFKDANDRFGHPKGDELLRALAHALAEGIRTSDVAARVGGDEFAVLVPESGVEEAVALAERLRSAAASQPSCVECGVTFSIGVASVQKGDDVAGILRRADEALYAAKREGRNRVRAA